MRFAVIGYGAFGRWHARCIDKIVETELIAIGAHSDASAAAARADFPNVRVYQDYRQLLAEPNIDAVCIVVPNHLHAEVGIAALEAGKDILLEKPMANTVADCDRLLASVIICCWRLLARKVLSAAGGQPLTRGLCSLVLSYK